MGCKLHYEASNLELISITSITNIITFIQFAFIPLEQVKNDTAEAETTFTSIDVSGVVKVLMAPFDFIDAFFKIAVPMRVLLSGVILIGFFNLLILSFFFPAWRLILFLCDIFLPGMAMMGTMWLVEDYEDQKAVASALAAVGWVYLVLRLAVFLYPIWRDRNDVGWDLRTARQLTAIFLARISKDKSVDPNTLDEMDSRMKRVVRDKDDAININDYFDESNAKKSKIKRFVDIGISAVLLIVMCVLQYGVTWRKMISKQYSGIQLDQIIEITDVVGNVFVGSFAVRLLIAIIFFFEKFKKALYWMRRRAFQGIIVLTGLILIPVVNLVLQSTEISQGTCPYNQFYDFNSTDQISFVDYFSDHPAGCTECSRAAWAISSCADVCARNNTYYAKFAAQAVYISEDDLTSIYAVPITLLEIYFLFILTQMLQTLFKQSRSIIELLPAPTLDVEAKFSSIIKKLISTGGYVFSSYTYKNSLFYFDFQQFKTFILFLSSLFPIFPETPKEDGTMVIREKASLIIAIIFAIVCLAIAMFNLFVNPYRSRLHNVANTASYFTGFITSCIAVVRAINQDTPPIVGTLAYILVVVVPIVATLILPLFLNFDITKIPVEYKLTDIMRKQKKIDKAKSKKNKKSKKKSEEDLSDSDSSSSAADDDPGFSLPEFDTLKLAPTYVQVGLEKGKRSYKEKISHVWKPCEIVEKDLQEATQKLFDVANELLDTTSYHALKIILNVSTIFVSFCAGWSLGAGVARWKTGNNYLKCNADYYPGVIE